MTLKNVILVAIGIYVIKSQVTKHEVRKMKGEELDLYLRNRTMIYELNNYGNLSDEEKGEINRHEEKIRCIANNVSLNEKEKTLLKLEEIKDFGNYLKVLKKKYDIKE